MSRLLRRVTVATFVMVLFIGAAVFGLWQRYDWGGISVYVDNRSDITRVVRITDASSGRGLGTVRLDRRSRTLVAQHRLDLWWRDFSPEERANGFRPGLRLELLGDACEAIDITVAGENDDLTLLPDSGFTSFSSDEPLPDLPLRQGTEIVTDDPCDGHPAPPLGLIVNATAVPIVIEGRVVVDPCSIFRAYPGDLARSMATAAPGDAVAVSVPSIAIQKARWPIEPRNVVVSRFDVFDDETAVIEPGVLDGCRGRPREDHDLIYPPDEVDS